MTRQLQSMSRHESYPSIPALLLKPGSLIRVTGISIAFLVGFVTKPLAAQPIAEPILDIGIVQRFGSDPGDAIVLDALPGDRLKIRFEGGDLQPQEITTNSVTLDIVMEPLADPQVIERIVLSTHRSFESAEDSANRWRSQGIDVEIAQPGRWQVWAKRDVYQSRLLRRLLLQNLQSHGVSGAFLDTQTQTEVPKAAFTINGYRYHRDQVEITTANRRTWVDPPGDGQQNRRIYGGDLRLQTNAYGTYTLVNQVPIETYLRGVVPHEIGLGAPQTTIEAQAILARTYALRNLRRFEIDNYELCADTQCQVYWGLSGAAAKSDQAIATTGLQVLTYQNELVDALYSSTTGGVTAPFSDVWNGVNRPYLQAVVDSVNNVWNLPQRSLDNEDNLKQFISINQGFNEDGWDMFRWRVEDTLAEIAADVRRYLDSVQHPLRSFTRIEVLEVTERSPAGRVQKMQVTTDQGTIELEKDEIMRALYAPNSTLFYLEPIYEAAPTAPITPTPSSTSAETSPSEGTAAANPLPILKGYAFVGGGFGHGVGMSQTGAYNLGELGWSSDRILSFYYPGTQVQPLNSNLVFWRDPANASEPQQTAELDKENEASESDSKDVKPSTRKR